MEASNITELRQRVQQLKELSNDMKISAQGYMISPESKKAMDGFYSELERIDLLSIPDIDEKKWLETAKTCETILLNTIQVITNSSSTTPQNIRAAFKDIFKGIDSNIERSKRDKMINTRVAIKIAEIKKARSAESYLDLLRGDKPPIPVIPRLFTGLEKSFQEQRQHKVKSHSNNQDTSIEKDLPKDEDSHASKSSP